MLTLAIPSKGRLKDNCNAWFAAAGVAMEQTAGARGYRASFAGFPDVEVMLLSAGEIASSLLQGDIHLGITGEDLLREAAPERARPSIGRRVHSSTEPRTQIATPSLPTNASRRAGA